jgi:hypothetical protein
MNLYKLNAKNMNTNLHRGFYILFVGNKKIDILNNYLLHYYNYLLEERHRATRFLFCHVPCMVFYLGFGPLNLIRLINPCITF